MHKAGENTKQRLYGLADAILAALGLGWQPADTAPPGEDVLVHQNGEVMEAYACGSGFITSGGMFLEEVTEWRRHPPLPLEAVLKQAKEAGE